MILNSKQRAMIEMAVYLDFDVKAVCENKDRFGVTKLNADSITGVCFEGELGRVLDEKPEEIPLAIIHHFEIIV